VPSTRPYLGVPTLHPPLRRGVHASLHPSLSAPPHRPAGQRFHLLCLFPHPRDTQLKRKKHSSSIVGRARQRLPSSLLIGDAPARHHPAGPKSHVLGPRHLRSRLATYQPSGFSPRPTTRELAITRAFLSPNNSSVEIVVKGEIDAGPAFNSSRMAIVHSKWYRAAGGPVTITKASQHT
jgi:hypothetical protein